MRSSARLRTNDWPIRPRPQRSARCWTDLLWKKLPSLPTKSKAGTRRVSIIQGHFIIQRIGTSTASCAISGEQIRRRTGVNSGAPSHHWFHYTDVPVVPAQRYGDGSAGRSKWDIVHMIPFCIQVLQGRVPEQNERRDYEARSTHFACSLRCRHSPAAACRRGIFRSAGASRGSQ